MKTKFIYIAMFAFTMMFANKITAQDQNQSLKNKVKETISEEECKEVAKILNSYHLPYGKFEAKNVYAAIDRSEIVFGSDLKGTISIHSVQEDGTVDETKKILPKAKDVFFCFNGKPIIQVISKRKIKVVEFQKDELPGREVAKVDSKKVEQPKAEPQPEPQNPIKTNTTTTSYTDPNGGTITVNVNCNKSSKKEKVDEGDQNQKKYPYEGKEYVQTSNGWAEFGTGYLVGSFMSQILTSVFFRPMQPFGYGYSTNVYGQPATYGSNIPGYWR